MLMCPSAEGAVAWTDVARQGNSSVDRRPCGDHFGAVAEMLLDDLRREVEAARVAADRWEDWARQSVLAKRDDLAREALKLRDLWQRQADEWQSKLEQVRLARI